MQLPSTQYFTGKPCKYGHIAPRTKSSRRCVSCSRESASKRYKNDPEKVKAIHKKYRTEKREQHLALKRERHRQRKEIESTARKAYYRKDPARFIKYQAEYCKANKEKVLERKRLWRKNNPHKQAAYDKRKRSELIVATPKWSDDEKVKQVYLEASRLGMSVDHIVPLRSKLVCGLHAHTNLQVMPLIENTVKQNRYWPDMPT